MSNISGGDGRVTRECNAGDLRVAKIHLASRLLPRSGERGRFACGRIVEIKDAILEIFLQQANE